VRNTLLLIGAVVMTLTSIGYAQTTAVVAGGPHDLSNGSALRNADPTIGGQTCIFCHTPHGGSNSIPLWNRAAPTGGSYQLYTSSTTISKTTTGQVAASVSGACLSCHDGTIAVDVLADVNGLAFGPSVSFTRQSTAKAGFGSAASGANNIMNSGLPFLGSDLRNDHPVSIVYQTSKSAKGSEFQSINAGSTITVGTSAYGSPLPLYGATAGDATVECASCHNPHDNHLGNFLRKENTGSAICLSCHIK
jgi:predicted CXXCH cytochrome family protein